MISKKQLKETPESLGLPGTEILQMQKKTIAAIKKSYLEEEEEEEDEVKEMRLKFTESLKDQQLFKGLKFFINR